MSFDDNNAVVPIVLRFSNWRREKVQKQLNSEHTKRQRSIAQILIYNYIPIAFTSTLLSPLNRIKVILQVQNFIPGVDQNNFTARSTLSHILKEEGVIGLFRGNLTYSFKILSHIGAKTIFFDRIKNRFAKSKEHIKTLKYKIFGINPVLDFLSAVTASMVSLVITYPLDFAYGRIAGQYKHDNSKFNYKTMRDAFHFNDSNNKIFFLSKYYYGFSAGLAQSLVYSTLTLLGYQIIYKINSQEKKEEKYFSKFMRMLGGSSVVALFAGAAAYPLDTIKRMMQVNGARGYKNEYSDSMLLFKEALNNPKALYKAFHLHLLRTLPFASIQYCIFHNITKILNSKKSVGTA